MSRDTVGRVKHNFGYARPEGYRKAIRLMELAERFNLPVISFVTKFRDEFEHYIEHGRPLAAAVSGTGA